jgi:L-aminopeptidase/D-esterase-like protein
MAPGKLDAITDVPGIKVGHWTNRRAATGCTVVLCERGAVGGVDVRGGAPGTLGTDALRPGTLIQEVHAVLLTGGSAFGLEAAAGVMRWCEDQVIGVSFGGARIPIVVGAVVFDLGIGRADVRPNLEAGYAAAAAAKAGRIEQGNAGAGAGATVAKAFGVERGFKGGIGTASEQIGDLIVGAIVAVNAVGEIVDDGRVIAGPRRPDDTFADSVRALAERSLPPAPANTTIAVIATNTRLSKEQACRLASVAHTGLARAIRPIHTMSDGDTAFALATGELANDEPQAIRALEALAPLAAERAVIKGVRAAKSLAGVPAVVDWPKFRSMTSPG